MAGFNGAASLMTRIFEAKDKMHNEAVTLQWGRVVDDADMSDRAEMGRSIGDGFNGAASLMTRI